MAPRGGSGSEAHDRRLHAPGSWQQPATHYLQVLKHPWYRTIVELEDALSVLTTEFWSARGARTIHLPITTCSISSPMGLGSDSLPVQVDIGRTKTYLADSMQFMLEFGCRVAPEGCYYLMPSFRGESADETHLSQFFHSEAEIVGAFNDVVETVEEYIHFLTRGLLDHLRARIESVAGDLEHLEGAVGDEPFERFTFDQATELLGEDPRFVKHDSSGWRTLTRAGERELIRGARGGFVWVTHMDHLSVPFYQAFADAERSTAKNGDLLFGIGETVGCGERHATADELDEAMCLHQVAPHDYEWYRDMKRLHPLRTSGFGMGVERFLLWVLKHDDIRDIPLLLRFNDLDIRP